MKKILVFAAALFATLIVFAQASKNVQDQQACDYARKKGTVEVWQDYLRQFPQGMCSFEAKSEIKNLNKRPQNKGLQWSKKAPGVMNWDDAVKYCKNLKEGKHNDWRLPDIDELRTLVQNHPGTRPGGSCPISEKAGKLHSRDWTTACHTEAYELSKEGWLWSSSTLPGNSNLAWSMFTDSEDVESTYRSFKGSVRCVR